MTRVFERHEVNPSRKLMLRVIGCNMVNFWNYAYLSKLLFSII